MKRILTAAAISVAVVSAAFAQTPLKPAATPEKTPSAKPARRTPNKQVLSSPWPGTGGAVRVPAAQPSGSNTDAEQLLDKARELFDQRKWVEALSSLREAEKAEPKHFETQIMLGVVYLILERFDESAASFEKAVKLDPKSPSARYNLCVALDRSGKPIEAIDECREATRLDPTQNGYRIQLARLYLLNDSANDALAMLEELYARYQDDLVFNGTLADSYLFAGEYPKAADMYERIAQRWPSADAVYIRLSDVYDLLERPTDSIEAAKKFAELRPKIALAHLNLGQKYQTFGYIDEAIAAYTKTVVLDKDCGPAYLGLSDMYEIAGDTERTLANLRLAYKLIPRDVALAYRVGRSLSHNDQHAEAIEPLEYANSKRPNTPDIMRALGVAYVISNLRYEEGAALINKANEISPPPPNIQMNFPPDLRRDLLDHFDEIKAAVKEDPSNIIARQDLARAYIFKNMMDEAEQQYLEIAKISPTVMTYSSLCAFYSERGQYEKALAANQKAIDLNPHHVLYSGRSYLLERVGRLDEAIAAARHAVEIKSESVESRFMLAELLLKKGDRPGALQQYQAAFDVASGDVRTNSRLAWLYIRMGNKEGALRHYAILNGILPGEWEYLEQALRARLWLRAPR